ncbi:LytR/AlgR family response regulator transcription factor [Hymenobacter terrenus]|uniref:LytR/AlgR family response regulator transcription factor n=1 Tax=Hymenobacter terrenus TaxID=1629124 RepID=UPI00061A0B07|nr:LytTR family transcriptional regulator DNA-binding domain-containing protein [Hymenobacter terrenus]
MKTRTVLIVEDEYIIAEHLRSMLYGLNYIVKAVAGSVAEALPYLQQTPLPDLVLLDITLGGELDGIDLAHRLRAMHSIPFVFITSLADAATLARVKSTRPHGYVVKPFTQSTVYAALEMAFANHAAEPAGGGAAPEPPEPMEPMPAATPDSLFVREGNRFVRVRVEDVLWVEAEGNYTSVYTSKAKHTLLSSLKEVAERLPTPTFLRIHKSYLVALSGISAVDRQGVHVGQHRLPVGRAYQAELMKRLGLRGLL